MFDQYDAIIAQAADTHRVPFLWIKAFIGTESSFNPRAYREEVRINDASHGLMQLLMRTARGLGYEGDAAGLFDPEININLGTKLMRELIDRFGTDFRRIYSAYNSGDASKYTWDKQVGQNVARAEDWLARFSPVAESAFPMLLALGFAGLFLLKGK